MPKLPKLKYQLPRFGLLIGGLLIVTLLTALSGLWHYQYEVAHQSLSKPSADKTTQAPVLGASKLGTSVSSASEQGTISNHSAVPGPAGSSTSRLTTSQNPVVANPVSPGSDSLQSVNGAPLAAHLSVNLSVNGQAKGSVQLLSGSKQCSVLTQALADGLISSLDMRYSSEYQTEAVYVIDGTGDPGAVWWTYKVNGLAPPYGCAYITAHDGDSINWQYIKK